MENVTVESFEDLEECCSSKDNRFNYFISSNVPAICKEEPCILGIDEAGRGPVLGPMVYGISYCPKSKEEDLKKTGCADSKTLTETKREDILKKFFEQGEFIGWDVEVISPTTISRLMLRRQKVSLNEISHNSAIGLVKRAQEAGVNVTEIYVDTVGPPEKYQAKLQEIFPELQVTVAKKADSTYPIVSAASICAKVTRDIALKLWKFPEFPGKTDVAVGSGYPADPETKRFLEEYFDPVFGFPQVVRFSWATATKIIDAKGVQMDWEDDDDSPPANTPSIKSFFKQANGTAVVEKHVFFQDRHLTNCTEL